MTALLHDPDGLSAREVSQLCLDRTGEALLSGDFDLFWPRFVLPQVLSTFEGKVTAETVADLRVIFDGVRAYMARSRVTGFLRVCIAADFQTPDHVRATHMSRLISGNQMIQRPYPVLSSIRRVEGIWKVADSHYAIADAPAHVQALTPREGFGHTSSHQDT